MLTRENRYLGKSVFQITDISYLSGSLIVLSKYAKNVIKIFKHSTGASQKYFARIKLWYSYILL